MIGKPKTICVLGILLVWAVCGCGGAAKKKPRPLRLRRDLTVEFQGVRDNKCKIRDVELNAATGNLVVVCKEEQPK